MKNILIIFNPQAGLKYPLNYKNFFLKNLKKYLPDTKYEWLETTPQLTGQLDNLNLALFKKIIIIGGDGTIKVTVDYLLENNLDLPLAIIPQGSTNVLAASLNLPSRLPAAVKTACLGQEKKIDIGCLNQTHYFMSCLSIGYWSKIVKDTDRGLKIRLGFWAYMVTFFKQRKIYQTDFNFNLDGENYNIRGNTLVIANALSLFKIQPAKPIDFFDGKFDVMIIKNKTLLGFLIISAFFFLNQRLMPAVFKKQGKKISVNYHSAKEKTVQLDGETIEVDKIEVEIIPQKLRIITSY